MVVTAKILVLILALEHVPDAGHADRGAAHGAFGIHRACIEDVNQHYGTRYTTESAHHRAEAIDITTKYLELYGQDNMTPEQAYELWRRGPTGYRAWLRSGRRSTAWYRGYRFYTPVYRDIRDIVQTIFAG